MQLLGAKSKAILGIDISSASVKALEISYDGKSHIVENYGVELLPEKTIEGGSIKDPDAVSAAIKRLVTRCKMRSTHVALAVSDSMVISKVIQINEGLNEQEMEELVVMEADKYIPYPIDEINIDFAVLGPAAKSPSMLDVLIVASRAEHISARANMLMRAGLEASVIDVESYCVERAVQMIKSQLPAEGKDKVIAVIDIGAKLTNLFVLEGMHITFSREEEFGGEQMIDMICDHYQVSRDKAFDMLEQEEKPKDFDEKISNPFHELMMLQIRRTLQFFYSTSNHSFVDHILLAGGVARQAGLAKMITDMMEVTATVANPFIDMKFGRAVHQDTLFHDAPSLMVACGLALRNTDEL